MIDEGTHAPSQSYQGGGMDLGGLFTGFGAGLLQMIGAGNQNKAMEMNSLEQMNFQRDMSSTAHFREVQDLKAAGLNPILSANSGASTPGGSMAGAVNTMDGLANSALKGIELKQAKELMDQQIQTQKEQNELLQYQKAKTIADEQAALASAGKMRAEDTAIRKAFPKLDAEAQIYQMLQKRGKGVDDSIEKTGDVLGWLMDRAKLNYDTAYDIDYQIKYWKEKFGFSSQQQMEAQEDARAIHEKARQIRERAKGVTPRALEEEKQNAKPGKPYRKAEAYD